jgi:hypothetical protein
MHFLFLKPKWVLLLSFRAMFVNRNAAMYFLLKDAHALVAVA